MKIVACVVANGRDELLQRSLSGIFSQTIKSDLVLVFDNAQQSSTKDICRAFGARYSTTGVNLGGAGGFSACMDLALKEKASHVWLLDDDGYPEPDCLEKLVAGMTLRNLSIVCPLSISESDQNRTSNAIWIGLRKTSSVAYLRRISFLPNVVHFFNGVLITANAIQRIGFPNGELFIRGDEIDYFFRSKKARVHMGMCTQASYLHKSSDSEYKMRRDFLFSANIPDEPMKRYYQFRNRGFLVRQNKLFLYLVYDLIRYPIAFLFFNKLDFKGLFDWARLYFLGFNKKLKPYRKEEQ